MRVASFSCDREGIEITLRPRGDQGWDRIGVGFDSPCQFIARWAGHRMSGIVRQWSLQLGWPHFYWMRMRMHYPFDREFDDEEDELVASPNEGASQ